MKNKTKGITIKVNGRIKKPYFRFCMNELPDGSRCDKRFQPTGKWNYLCETCIEKNRIKNKIKNSKRIK